jgi:hypothetical protein
MRLAHPHPAHRIAPFMGSHHLARPSLWVDTLLARRFGRVSGSLQRFSVTGVHADTSDAA